MMCTAPYGNVAPGVAGEVNPRGSRLMNASLRTGSTSMSSFSQMYIGRAPSNEGAAGSATLYAYRPVVAETSIVSPMKFTAIAVRISGMFATNSTFEEMAPGGGGAADDALG